MADLQDWLSKLDIQQPDVKVVVDKIQNYITDTGFNIDKFEKAIEAGIKKINSDLLNSLKENNGKS